MSSLIILLIFLFVVLLFIALIWKSKSRKTNLPIVNPDNLIPYDINGRKISVYKSNDQSDALDILQKVSANIDKFTAYLDANKSSYPEYIPYINQYLTNIKQLELLENPPINKYTSYTINKGKSMGICLRSKRTTKLHELNTIMYVVIHELSHIACPEIEHTALFRHIFKQFLTIAIKIGIYNPESYDVTPTYYCGMTIRENLLTE